MNRTPHIRRQLAVRDGAACVWCRCALDPDDGEHATLDHLLPESSHGRRAQANLVLACRPCNQARGSRVVAAWVQSLLDRGRDPNLVVIEAALVRLSQQQTVLGWPGERHRLHGAYQLERLSYLLRRRRRAHKRALRRAAAEAKAQQLAA